MSSCESGGCPPDRRPAIVSGPAEARGVLTLSRGDLEDHAAVRADGHGVVLPGVLVCQFVDVPPGLVAGDGLDHVSPDLGPVVGVLAVDQHGDARVAGHVPGPLPLWLGVDQDVLAVGVDPGEQGLRLPVRHQGHHGGQVLALSEPGHVLVERHPDLLALAVRAPADVSPAPVPGLLSPSPRPSAAPASGAGPRYQAGSRSQDPAQPAFSRISGAAFGVSSMIEYTFAL